MKHTNWKWRKQCKQWTLLISDMHADIPSHAWCHSMHSLCRTWACQTFDGKRECAASPAHALEWQLHSGVTIEDHVLWDTSCTICDSRCSAEWALSHVGCGALQWQCWRDFPLCRSHSGKTSLAEDLSQLDPAEEEMSEKGIIKIRFPSNGSNSQSRSQTNNVEMLNCGVRKLKALCTWMVALMQLDKFLEPETWLGVICWVLRWFEWAHMTGIITCFWVDCVDCLEHNIESPSGG